MLDMRRQFEYIFMKKQLATLFIFLVVLGQSFGSDADRIFAEGNKAYEAKDYAKAIEIYEQLQAAGRQSADLEYNLGNAWYRSGSIGWAVLHYERALLLDAGHEAAAKNIEFLRSKSLNDIEPLPPFFLTKWWNAARMSLSSTAMGVLALVIWWAGFGVLIAWRLRKMPRGLWAGVVLILLSLLPLSLSLSRTFLEGNSKQAILIQKTAILRSTPDDGSQEVLTISEGTKLEQVKHVEGWWQVRLLNGELGWLPELAMERI
jgi:tetratricopeptide (TPR) repeat protein